MRASDSFAWLRTWLLALRFALTIAWNALIAVPSSQAQKKKKETLRGLPRIELGASPTRKENHTTRPQSQYGHSRRSLTISMLSFYQTWPPGATDEQEALGVGPCRLWIAGVVPKSPLPMPKPSSTLGLCPPHTIPQGAFWNRL
jgi:hypothetical protein